MGVYFVDGLVVVLGYVVFSVQCIFTSSLNNCFSICAQNVSFSWISFADHSVRNFFLLVLDMNHF